MTCSTTCWDNLLYDLDNSFMYSKLRLQIHRDHKHMFLKTEIPYINRVPYKRTLLYPVNDQFNAILNTFFTHQQFINTLLKRIRICLYILTVITVSFIFIKQNVKVSHTALNSMLYGCVLSYRINMNACIFCWMCQNFVIGCFLTFKMYQSWARLTYDNSHQCQEKQCIS